MLRFDAVTVSIKQEPEKVWEFVADLNNWKQFSGFGPDIEQVGDNEWVAHTSWGDVKVVPKFDRQKLLLDHNYIFPSGEERFMPSRVSASGEGSVLIMTNRQTTGIPDYEYEQQLKLMENELSSIKKILEGDT